MVIKSFLNILSDAIRQFQSSSKCFIVFYVEFLTEGGAAESFATLTTVRSDDLAQARNQGGQGKICKIFVPPPWKNVLHIV